MIRRVLQIMRYSLERRGIAASLRRGPLFVVDRALFRLREWREGFDRENRTDTSRIVEAFDLDTDSPNATHAVHYRPTTTELGRRILASLPIAHERFVFVDVGSGKGRMLLLASDYPYRRIVGVELATRLHAIAEDNVRRYRHPRQRCRDIELVCADAADYELPDEPLVLYLYHPFQRPMVEGFADRLEASLRASPRSAVVAYAYPYHGDLFERGPMRCIVREDRFAVYATSDVSG